MAYTIDQGYREPHGLDRVQRGLLIGLPLLALALMFGAFRHHGSSNGTTGANAKLIPIVSTLSDSTDKSSGSSGSSTGDSSTAASTGAAGSTGSGSTAFQSSGSGAVAPSGGGGSSPAPVVGGMGGGPTGGSGGGSVVVPNCSIGQIATVNCMVPACTPAVNRAPGQKAILGVGGTCIVVN
jgi:hypothetical protein